MVAHLLLVDDDESFHSLITRHLGKGGCTIEVAVDGQAGWEVLDAKPSQFDLVLLDKQMPRMDGITLLRKVKADKRFQDLPVVMLTADKGEEDVIQGLAAGALNYLTKPVEKAVLEVVVKNVVAEFRQKRALRELTGQHANYLKLLHRGEFAYKTLAEANDLALLFSQVSMNPSRTLNGYRELLINAVEHGNLAITYAEKSQLLSEDRWEEEIAARLCNAKYSRREVKVTLEKSNTACVVTIEDQGAGFDWKSYLDFSPERAFDFHGRGIAMSKVASFDALEYLGNGNIVVTTVLIGE